jgi:sugar lactone lactonase YvrE
MKTNAKFLIMIMVLVGIVAVTAHAQSTLYVATNDDVAKGGAGFNSTTLYSGTPASLKAIPGSPFSTGSYGGGGGYFGTPRANINVTPNGDCIFVADAGGTSGLGPGDIAAFSFSKNTLNLVGRTSSAVGGNGDLDGIGIVVRGNILYASWSATGQIETFIVSPACVLTPTKMSAPAIGLNGGAIDDMAVDHAQRVLVATYADGSVGAYKLDRLTGGITPGRQFIANCFTTQGGLPVGVAIDAQSHWALFDCLGGTGAVIDVTDLRTFKSSQTYGPLTAAGGTAIFESNTMALSLDNSTLYIAGTYSGSVESANFDKLTGVVTANSCDNATVPGHESLYEYFGNITVTGMGMGNTVELALVGVGDSGNNSYVDTLTVGSGGCLTQAGQFTDPTSPVVISESSFATQ